jgi:hypothetical protein
MRRPNGTTRETRFYSKAAGDMNVNKAFSPAVILQRTIPCDTIHGFRLDSCLPPFPDGFQEASAGQKPRWVPAAAAGQKPDSLICVAPA